MRSLSVVALLGATIFAQPAVAQPLSRFSEEKAALLLRDKLPCLGCHQLGNEGGRLAPDLATVRTRRSAAYISQIVADPQRVRPGSMMPKHALPASQQELIVRYLSTRPGGSQDNSAAAATAGASDHSAAALYARFCAGCHGSKGGGDGPNAQYLPVPPAAHRSGSAMSARSDDALFDTIAGGGEIMNRSPRMPAFGSTLTAEEITSLVRYIRSLCNCEGPGWSRDTRHE